jgi:tetratricopeptide (TPR) repeat protein
MAEELGITDLIPHLLVNIGGARTGRGDAAGIEDLERALELALAANDPEAARVYNNLASRHSDLGDLARATELWLEGKRVAERFGNTMVRRFIEGQLFWRDYEDGRWDESLRAADAFIAECEAGSPHYLESTAHWCRAAILLGRGHDAAALAATERALELARALGDPQTVLPTLAVAVRVNAELGRDGAARAAIREMVSFAGRGHPLRGIPLALVAEDLDVVDDVRQALSGAERGQFTQIARDILDGKLEQAADALRDAGSRPDEADVRLRAAARLSAEGRRAEADEQLRRALEFYRSVGATRYIGKAEALLSATA